jgi:hypothetical protein
MPEKGRRLDEGSDVFSIWEVEDSSLTMFNPMV